MNFSDAFQQTNRLVNFSPDGQYVASCCQYRLVVRDSKTLQIVQLQTCVDPVQVFSWSPDSLFLMCGMLKRGVVQVSKSLHLVTNLIVHTLGYALCTLKMHEVRNFWYCLNKEFRALNLSVISSSLLLISCYINVDCWFDIRLLFVSGLVY